MAFYRKKPVVIEAIQYKGHNIDIIRKFLGDNIVSEEYDTDVSKTYPTEIQIRTLEGYMYASLNDYIIKGIKGEFYPCKPDIFYKTYDPALDIEHIAINTDGHFCTACLAKLEPMEKQDHYYCPNCGIEYIVK